MSEQLVKATYEMQENRAVSSVRKMRNSMSGARLPWVPIGILGFFLFSIAFAGWISPFSPTDMNLYDRLQAPAWIDGGKHLLGTDLLGRDLLARVLYGARVSLAVAAAGLAFGGGIGLLVGIVAGYLGGITDSVLMRLTDCFMALPSLLIALVVVMAVGPGLETIIAAMAVITWARFSRIIRSEALTLRRREYILQAEVAGCSSLRIMLVHILPNVFNTFVIIASLQVSQCILTEATLSFLGAGIPPPTPTWGNMISDGKDYLASAWWISIFPGIALSLVVFSFNRLGDWLRDRLDPKLRQI
jgi:peptide/nickel transport system permease protein